MCRSFFWLWIGSACLFAGGIDSVAGDDLFFESASGKLRYFTEGAGETVLLLHGFAEDSRKGWIEPGIMAGLVKAQFRVVAIDCLGHGASSRPHTLNVYGHGIVNSVIGLLDALNIKKVHGVGYSMGAALMAKMLEQHPERFLSATLSGYGKPPLPEQVTEELVDEIRSNLERMQLAEGNDPRALANLSVGWNEWLVSNESLGRNTVPALALIGADDVFLSDTRKLVEAMSQCQLEIVSGDHGTARRQAHYLTRLVTFLNQNRASE